MKKKVVNFLNFRCGEKKKKKEILKVMEINFQGNFSKYEFHFQDKEMCTKKYIKLINFYFNIRKWCMKKNIYFK